MPFVCKKCDKSFHARSSLKKHINRQNPCVSDLRCSKCHVEFYDIKALRRHQQRKTPCDIVIEDYDVDADNLCEFCNRSFSTSRSLSRHLDSCKARQNNTDEPTQETLKCQILNLEKENEQLKLELEKSRHQHQNRSEYVYIIQEREFIRLKETTYKVGRTSTGPNNRLKSYPKGSRTIMVINVKNSVEAEHKLVKKFKKRFEHKKEYGNEYFQGDLEEMKTCMLRIALKY